MINPWADTDSKKSTHGDNMPPLNGVRGLATLLVIGSHMGAWGMAGQGATGVLLFFVLSGFVLAIPFVDNPSSITFGSFFANRSLRILPAYILALVVIGYGHDAGWYWRHITFQQGSGHLWSVVEEVRFYLLFPFVIALLALLPSLKSRIVALVGMILLAYLGRNLVPIDMGGGNKVEFFFYYFLIGVLACFVSPLAARLPIWIFTAISNIILLCILFCSNDVAEWLGMAPGVGLTAMHHSEIWAPMMGLFLLGVTLAQRSIASLLMQSWLLRHIGLLSYSLYLFHEPVAEAFRPFGIGGAIGVLFVTYAVAVVTYIAFEKPFLALKVRGLPATQRTRLARMMP